MMRFLQLHALTFYPPANLNRDDTGRPKTAVVGGVPRLRISSQALKRAWRTSVVFSDALGGHMGVRTQLIGVKVFEKLREEGVQDERAKQVVKKILPLFGTPKDGGDQNSEDWAKTEELVFVSPDEQRKAIEEAFRLMKDPTATVTAEEILRRVDTAVDIAMFGRMLAKTPFYNREAAVQVAHAFTTHRVEVEDDYYTAVDDLKKAEEDVGAGFLGELGFGSGLFYLYVCVNCELLLKNLDGNRALADKATAALVEAMATVAPRGKQPSFAARGRAQYLLAERGSKQPRTLAGAFQTPVAGQDLAKASLEALRAWRDRLDDAYGPCVDASCEMDVAGGKGSLRNIVEFARAD